MVESLALTLFSSQDKAVEFNSVHLSTLNKLFNRLAVPEFYPRISWLSGVMKTFYKPFLQSRKRSLYKFVIDRGLNFSGLEDFVNYSNSEIFLENQKFSKELERFVNEKECLHNSEMELEALAKRRGELKGEIPVLESYLKEKYKEYEDRVLTLFVRLREYSFWKLKSDIAFTDKLQSLQTKLDSTNFSFWSYWREILKCSPVVISTALSVRNVFPCKPEIVDTIIVDEAGQTSLSYGLSIFVRGRKFVAIGDRKQLEPIKSDLPDIYEEKLREIFSGLPEHLRFDKSILDTVDKIDRTEEGKKTLREHLRCNRKIIEFCNKLMKYDLDIRTKDRLYGLEKRFFDSNLNRLFQHPLIFINVKEGRSSRDIYGSYHNKKEAETIVKFIRKLVEFINIEDIGILTPYRTQANMINSFLVREFGKSVDEKKLVAGTVHKLQGDERDIVIMSAVIAEGEKLKSSLWNKPNLVNVAVSRAKRHFILVGDKEAIEHIQKDNHPLFCLKKHIEDHGIILESNDLSFIHHDSHTLHL